MAVVIEFLRDHPEHIDTLATWFHDQWGRDNPNASLAKRKELLRANLNADRIPFTTVALSDGDPVGSATVCPQDLVSRRDLSPWLASVYVRSDARRRGIGSALVQFAERKAHALGTKTLYLFTYDQERLYARLVGSFWRVTRTVGRMWSSCRSLSARARGTSD